MATHPCLENPRDGGAWWAAVHGVAQSRTRLKQLSSSSSNTFLGFPGSAVKESACQCRRHKRRGYNPWVGKILWRRKWQPTLVFLPRKFHGQKSLVGHNPQGHKVLDKTQHACACMHTHTYTHIHKTPSY